jgi:hypothetical protein
MDKDSAYRKRKKLKGEVSVNLFLKDEVLNAIDREVEYRQKAGKKTNRSQVTNEWIWEAMESLNLTQGMTVET